MNIRSLLSTIVLGVLLVPAAFAQELQPLDTPPSAPAPIPTLYQEEASDENEAVEGEEVEAVEAEEISTEEPSVVERVFQKDLARCKTIQNPASRRQCIFGVERARRARAPRAFMKRANTDEARAAFVEVQQAYKEKAEAARTERKERMEAVREQIRTRLQQPVDAEQAGLRRQVPSFGGKLLRRRGINSAIRGAGAVNTQAADVEGNVETRSVEE